MAVERGDLGPMKAVTSTGCTCYVSLRDTAAMVNKAHSTIDDSLTTIKPALVKRVGNLVRIHVTWHASAFTLRDKAGKVINHFPASNETALLDLEYRNDSWFVYWFGQGQK